ncbi:MAG: hypothetical protein M1839_002419 [Geoglossum umbratile]|nr:MAG: hypothetical protein M1839_002419 [Geoglossum umbratile]
MGLKENGTPYLRAKKTVDDEVWLLIETFTNAAISIPYATLYTFLEHAERSQQGSEGAEQTRLREKAAPRTELMKRPRTPEEQLGIGDEARFAASEDKAERKAYEEDGAWGRNKTRR